MRSSSGNLRSLLFLSIWLFQLMVFILLFKMYEPGKYNPSFFDDLTIGFLLMDIAFTAIAVHRLCGPREKFAGHIYSLVLVCCALVVFLLPLLKGYPIYGRDDEPTNIYFVRFMIENGATQNQMIYPGGLLLSAIVSESTGVDIAVMSQFILAIVFLSGVLAFFAIFRRFFKSSVLPSGVMLAFSTILIYGGYDEFNVRFVTNSISIMYLPFVLWVFLSHRSDARFNIASIVVIPLFVLLHPLSVLVVVAIFLYFAFVRTPRKDNTKSSFGIGLPATRVSRDITSLLLTSIMLLILYLNTVNSSVFRMTILRGLSFLMGEGSSGGLTSIIQMEKLTSDLIGSVVLFFKLYPFLVIISISTVYVLVIGLSRKRDENHPSPDRRSFERHLQRSVLLGLFGSVILFALAWFGYMGFGPLRLLSYISLFIFLLLVMSLTENRNVSVRRSRIRKSSLVFFVCILVVAGWAGTFNYPSKDLPNIQMTDQDIEGSRWFFGNEDQQLPILTVMSIDPTRFAHASLSANLVPVLAKPAPIPDHFGYQSHSSLGEVLNDTSYVIIDDYSRQLYVSVWEEVNRYTNVDFEHFENNDQSSVRVIDNGDFRVYLAYPIG